MTFDKLLKEKKEVYFINYNKLAEFIAYHYGLSKLDICDVDNDMDYTFNLSLNLYSNPFSSYELDIINNCKRNENIDYYELNVVLEDLCRKGHIPKGIIIIMEVSW
jgi:hypothetical protein